MRGEWETADLEKLKPSRAFDLLRLNIDGMRQFGRFFVRNA
jgi:hypothetical protein